MMTDWLTGFDGAALERLVAVLGHTLWQGALIAAGLYLYLKVTRSGQTDRRYGAGVVALGAVVVAAFATWGALSFDPVVDRSPANSVAQTNDARPFPASSGRSGAIDGRHVASTKWSPPTSASHRPEMSDALGVGAQISPPANASTTTWTTWLAAGWLVGVAAMLARAVALLVGAGRVRRRCEVLDDSHARDIADALLEAMGVSRRVVVLVGERLASPVAFGVIWPAVLLPASMLTGLPPEQLRVVLAHEFAHIRRHDYLVNLCQILVESLLFFNPAAWWISRQIRVEREACCDAVAASVVGRPIDYARALADVASRLPQTSPEPLAAAALSLKGGDRQGALLDRVRRLVVPGHRPALRLPLHSLIGATIVGLLAFTGLWQATDLAVAAAEDFMSPMERIEKLKSVKDSHALPDKDLPGTDPDAKYGPETRITISGTVRTEDGEPLPKGFRRFTLVSKRENSTSYIDVRARGGTFNQAVTYGTLYLTGEAKGYARLFAPPLTAEPGGVIEEIDLLFKRGFVWRCRLMDEAGFAIPEARVALRYDHPRYINDKFTSDADGYVTVEHCAELPLILTVEADGYQNDKQTFDFNQTEPTVWTLKKAEPARGVIVAAETGQPIPGAELRLARVRGPNSMGYDPDDAKVVTVTNARGEFELTELRDDSIYNYVVVAQGYRWEFLTDVMPGLTDLRLEMRSEIVVKGKIIGPLDRLTLVQKKPSLTYFKSLRIDDSNSSYHKWAPVRIEGDTGYFEIKDLWTGTMGIHPPGLPRISLDLSESVDELLIDLNRTGVTVDGKPLPTSPTRQVIIRLDTPPGAPMAEGALTVGKLEIKDGNHYMESKRLPIEYGKVTLDVPVPGKVSYKPTGVIGYWIKENWSSKVPEGDDPYTIFVEAIPAGAIYGRMLEADGSPAHSTLMTIVTVKRSPLAPQGSLGVELKNSASGKSDEIERFMAAPLPLGGIYAIVAHRGMNYAVSEPVPLGKASPMREIELRYGKTVIVEGRILKPDGSPLAGAEYHLGFSPTLGHGFGIQEKWADRLGRFTIEDVNPDAPGKYTVTVKNNPGYQAVYQEFDPRKPIVVQLKKGIELRGVVVDSVNGWPVPGVEVYALPEYRPGKNHGYVDADAKTNDKGEFIFTTLEDVEHAVHVRSGNTVNQERIDPSSLTEPHVVRMRIESWSKVKPRKPED